MPLDFDSMLVCSLLGALPQQLNCLFLHLALPLSCAGKCIHMYDLAVKQRIVRPILQLAVGDASTSSSNSSINAMAVNAQVPSMLAAAAGDVVTVWQLPQQLVEPRTGEAKLLRRMLDSEDVSALLRAQCIVGS